jgi:FkbM family methyltransferase
MEQLKNRARSLLVRTGPLYDICKRALLVFGYRAKRIHDPDFMFFRCFNGPPGLFVDVGANIGQSALSFRLVNHSFRILSFESNPLLKKDLRFARRLLGQDFHYVMAGLGETTGTMVCEVPYVGNTPLTQAASFVPGMIAGRTLTIEARVGSSFEVRPLICSLLKFDELGLAPDIVKIDVEGYELNVLKGMRDTLARCAPVLMLENSPGAKQVRLWLSGQGYRFFAYDARKNELREEVTLASVNNYFALTGRSIEALSGRFAPSIHLKMAHNGSGPGVI